MADVDALLASMTSEQIAGWAAFAEIEPFGPLRDDQRAATAASVIANSIPFRGRGAKTIRPADIFTSLAPPFRPQTADEMADYARSATIAAGGFVGTIKRDSSDGASKRRPGNRHRGKPGRSPRRPR